MKKLISILLSVLLILPVIASFGVSAEETNVDYKELIQQKEAYIREQFADYFNGEFIGEFYYYWPLISPSLTVLLYTDVGKELTIVRTEDDGSDIVMIDETWFRFKDGYLTSPELTEAIEACRTKPYAVRESVSGLRECIQYFGITKPELIAAFERMREEPDAIRPLLTMLTDDEYEAAKRDDGTFGKTDWPEFVIEALFMEDDAMAHRLLTEPYAVYVPELGRIVETYELSHTFAHHVTFEKLQAYDLTSDAMGEFIGYLQQSCSNNPDTPYAKEIAKLAAAREAQLQAKQTGDSTVTSVLVLAIALPTLAALVWVRKKRKI